MPVASSTVEVAQLFNETYDRVGWYVGDDTFVPYFNPSNSAITFLPGEFVLRQFGGTGVQEVMMVQDAIQPGQWGQMARYFAADVACNFSANVILGDEVMWDIDNDVVSLAADVTNGFIIGRASIALSAKPVGLDAPTVDGSDRIVCATSSSTKVRVISIPHTDITPKGTVTVY